MDFLDINEIVKASELIEIVVPCISPETFKLQKKFKLVKGVEGVYGKWPETLGNGFFIDKRFIFDYGITMFKDKIFETYKEHSHASEYYDATEELIDLFRNKITPNMEDQYAISVLGKIQNREDVYL
jgi:hypothetical protein